MSEAQSPKRRAPRSASASSASSPPVPPPWRYPYQPTRYRENPACFDYEKLLGNSDLNLTPEEFLTLTQEGVLSPEERARCKEECAKLSVQEQMRGEPPAYMSTPGLRVGEPENHPLMYTAPDGTRKMLRPKWSKWNTAPAEAQEKPPRQRRRRLRKPQDEPDPEAVAMLRDAIEADLTGGPDPLAPSADMGGLEEVTTSARETEEECCAAASPLPLGPGSPGGADQPPPRDGAKPGKKRTPRCTKSVLRYRRERVADWMLAGGSSAQVIQACADEFGVKRRQAQLYMKMVRTQWANRGSRQDHLALLYQSQEQCNKLLTRAVMDLNRITDPTKSPNMLRTIVSILKLRDEKAEEIRHHRRITRRDKSPDSRSATQLREEILSMPFDEFLERIECLRNHWFHEWNQCRLAEKKREGTLGPGHVESPYLAAHTDPRRKPNPALAPGDEYYI